MADQRIIIDIVNNVKIQSTTAESPKANLNKNTKPSKSSVSSSSNTGENKASGGKFDSLLSAQFIAGNIQKFANATGNPEMIQISSATGKMVKYGTAIHSAMNGNPIGIIAAGIELIAQVVENFCNEQRKKAEEQNNVDMSRINAGLMDISNVKIGKNFWGQMTYEAK